MKKNLFYSLMALFVVLFASCGQEEIVSDNGTEINAPVTISVQAPVNNVFSRAGVAIPNGYTMQCIMQLLNADGDKIGDQVTKPVTDGKVSFTISVDEQKEVSKALFWAEYVPESGAANKVYNTADLRAVGYNTASFDLTNDALMAASDAFCGKLETIGNASVTLKRPFANVSVKPKNPEVAAQADKLEITYNALSGYDILEGKCTATAPVTYTNASFVSADGNWFANFFFAPSNVGKFTEEITMTLSGGYSKEIKIPANTLPLDANMQIMAKFEIGDGNFDIEVGVDPDYEALEMKVGSYINAEGKVVRDAADAIGIVFKMEAIGSDVPANYPVALQGKTIAGYAVVIENVATARQSLNPDGVLTNLVETAASMTNGTQITEALLTSIGDVAFKTTYEKWVGEHSLSSENLSAWYIPTLSQLSAFMGTLFTMKGIPATGSEDFRNLPEFEFVNGKMFDRETIATVNYASSTINNQSNVSGVRINVANGVVTDATEAGIDVKGKTNQQALCRPMITIFK